MLQTKESQRSVEHETDDTDESVRWLDSLRDVMALPTSAPSPTRSVDENESTRWMNSLRNVMRCSTTPSHVADDQRSSAKPQEQWTIDKLQRHDQPTAGANTDVETNADVEFGPNVDQTPDVPTYESAREKAISHAVSRSEFEIDIQPIISLTCGDRFGVEALARWNSPERGRLMPAEFLPFLSSMNLSGAFESLIINKAISSFAQWRKSGRPPGSIWINISPANLEAPFPDYLAGIIDVYDVRPDQVVLELTSDATANTPDRIAVLHGIQKLGIAVAIDDFGTGHAQLSYLHELPMNYVKLDRSFVSEIDSEPNRAAIAESVIELAHKIGVKVVAEGVERQNELDALTELGCDLAQGYFLERPNSPTEICGEY